MPDHEIFKEHDPEDCFYSCRTVHDFMRLTDEMVHTITGERETGPYEEACQGHR